MGCSYLEIYVDLRDLPSGTFFSYFEVLNPNPLSDGPHRSIYYGFQIPPFSLGSPFGALWLAGCVGVEKLFFSWGRNFSTVRNHLGSLAPGLNPRLKLLNLWKLHMDTFFPVILPMKIRKKPWRGVRHFSTFGGIISLGIRRIVISYWNFLLGFRDLGHHSPTTLALGSRSCGCTGGSLFILLACLLSCLLTCFTRSSL